MKIKIKPKVLKEMSKEKLLETKKEFEKALTISKVGVKIKHEHSKELKKNIARINTFLKKYEN